ncbi:MAG: hypothetical protein ABJF01_00900 [bacterium]
MRQMLRIFAVTCAAVCAVAFAKPHAGPDHVDITWMSVTNMYFQAGEARVVADGYITRLPDKLFYANFDSTRESATPDTVAVKRVLTALGGPSSVNLLLTGHSHWDHAFDTPAWSTLSGAKIIGSKTTCFLAIASKVPAGRCTPVDGGEKFVVGDGVTMYVVRWNHSGDPAKNPRLHNPIELTRPPTPDPRTGGLRAGVTEDFVNGGGNRGYLFVVDGAGGRYSWYFSNSGSAVDLNVPIVLDGKNYGAPIENLQSAMKAAGISSVDLWIGADDIDVARLVVPVLHPRAFLPVHWDNFLAPFEAGVTKPYSNPVLSSYLAGAKVQLMTPLQYMDKWRLDRTGIRPIPNDDVKKVLGFSR